MSKNKIYNYDFLIIGAGLVGSLTAISLLKKNYKVLVLEKNKSIRNDRRTLAVNANSRDFLKSLGLWSKISKNSEPIDKIIIKDFINDDNLSFDNPDEPMGSVIYNCDFFEYQEKSYKIRNVSCFMIFKQLIVNLMQKKLYLLITKKFNFKKIILTLGKNYNQKLGIKKIFF